MRRTPTAITIANNKIVVKVNPRLISLDWTVGFRLWLGKLTNFYMRQAQEYPGALHIL